MPVSAKKEVQSWSHTWIKWIKYIWKKTYCKSVQKTVLGRKKRKKKQTNKNNRDNCNFLCHIQLHYKLLLLICLYFAVTFFFNFITYSDKVMIVSYVFFLNKIQQHKPFKLMWNPLIKNYTEIVIRSIRRLVFHLITKMLFSFAFQLVLWF